MLASPAFAHHAMGGTVPTTFFEGLLSGLAHPVIGPDHFAFIVAIGIAAAIVPGGIGLIGAFLAASTLGVLAHIGAVNLPLADTLAAGSVIVAGALIAAGRRAGAGVWLALVVLAGLIHGYALGESIVGADRPTLGAYLLGLAVVAAVVASAIMLFARGLVARSDQHEMRMRTAGVVLGCAGVILLAVGIVG
jgi:urease accessory protein